MSYRGRARRRVDPRTGRLTQLLGPVPRALRHAKLDNLSLVPGSILLTQPNYQAIANRLPRGQVLIVLPTHGRPARRASEGVVSLLRSKGKQVVVLAAENVWATG